MGSDCLNHEWWVRAHGADESIVTAVLLDPEVEVGGTGKQSLNYESFLPTSITFKYS